MIGMIRRWRWKREQQAQAQLKDMLYKILEPYDVLEKDPPAEQEVAAKAALIECLNTLRGTPPAKVLQNKNDRMYYLRYLYFVERELRRDQYAGACHELIEMIYFEPILQPRIWGNLIGLLSDYTEV